jgi:hypothetical protein
MYYLARDVGAQYFITELFRNNAIICSQITEQHIQKIVNTIVEGCRYPQFVEMLEILCIVNKKPLRRNQSIVVKLLIEKQQVCVVVRVGSCLFRLIVAYSSYTCDGCS